MIKVDPLFDCDICLQGYETISFRATGVIAGPSMNVSRHPWPFAYHEKIINDVRGPSPMCYQNSSTVMASVIEPCVRTVRDKSQEGTFD